MTLKKLYKIILYLLYTTSGGWIQFFLLNSNRDLMYVSYTQNDNPRNICRSGFCMIIINGKLQKIKSFFRSAENSTTTTSMRYIITNELFTRKLRVSFSTIMEHLTHSSQIVILHLEELALNQHTHTQLYNVERMSAQKIIFALKYLKAINFTLTI